MIAGSLSDLTVLFGFIGNEASEESILEKI